ncbi:MAG: ABC transporter ATP-binding protein/permease [Mollicutes bacterium UO1]
MAAAISCYALYEFNFGKDGKINWFFLVIAFALFLVLIISEVILFKKASKLNVAAKKRQEEDNKVIYERINNLEYIKAVSGEKYEEEKISQQLDDTFRKNEKALWYSTMFKTIPNYMVVPNIPIFFLSATLTLVDESSIKSPVYTVGNFSSYFMSVKGLNSEVGKIVDALLTLDELSSNLEIVNESVQILHRPLALPSQKLALSKTQSFVNGDIIFQKVIFAYPKRPRQDILQNFTFTFQQGKIYGIAGKNGIGKSTITKTTLKLYDLKAGKILIGQQNVQAIDTVSLHRHICYQTNRPTFFGMSIAENVCYPNKYDKKDYNKLV